MTASVSATQLADELNIAPSRLTRWLRKEAAAGNPLLTGRAPGRPWLFTVKVAEQLAAEFLASASQDSDSGVQRRAEAVIRDRLAGRLGMPLEPKVVRLAAGAPMHIDAVSRDGLLMAEIFARQGELKGGQQKKVAIDTLKLITIRRERPGTKLIVAFADEEAAAYAQDGGWVAHALRTWGVDVEVVEIPRELRDEIRAAQSKQRMTNADEEAGDVAGDA